MSAITRANVTIEYRSLDEVRGNAVAFGETVPGALHVPLRQLAPEPRVEILASDELLFGTITVEETKPLEEISRETYAGLIQQVRDAGFPYFVRVWNFVGDINEVEGRERYQLF